MCPETAAPQQERGRGGPLYLLSWIKPQDAVTSSAERLQSKLVQTFPRGHFFYEKVIKVKADVAAPPLCLTFATFPQKSLR